MKSSRIASHQNVKTIRKAQKPTMQGREGGRRQVTLCRQQTTVHFSVVIDRASVSPGIVRALRAGWRTINCAVFVTDERSALSLQKTGQTWLPFEFVVCLCCTHILICIREVLHRWMSSWRCMSKIRSSHAHCSAKAMNISQVMISHALVCKIHTLCHTNRLRNVSWCICRST